MLPVVANQDVVESQYRKVPRDQLNISLSDKEVSTLLVVSTTDKKTISNHVEI